jgi:cytochrome-b5 reductase
VWLTSTLPLQIVGGTGITPAYQLLNTALSKHAQASNMLSKSLPRFTILYGATKPSSFLLLPELAALKKDFPEQIDIHLQVDRLDKSTASSTSWLEWVRGDTPTLEGLDLRVGRIDEKAVKRALESSDKDTEASRRILVCGPEKMIASVAGSKQGKMQGKLGGLLADLNCTEEEVFKL